MIGNTEGLSELTGRFGLPIEHDNLVADVDVQRLAENLAKQQGQSVDQSSYFIVQAVRMAVNGQLG